jgi:nitrogen-specific signal transduction histidine kinase
MKPMKKRFKKKKRETLPMILIKSFSVAITLCLVFAYGFWEYLDREALNQAANNIAGNVSSVQSWINQTEAKNSSRDTMSELSRYLSKYVFFDIMFEDELSKNGGPQIVPRYSESNHALAAVVDKDNNIVANNLLTLQVFIKFDKNAPDNGYYICPEKNNIPEVQQLYNEYRQLSKEEILNSWIEMKLESAYVNKKDYTFIPHKGSMTLKKYDYDNVPENSYPEYRILRTKEIDINIDDDNYELLELDNLSSKNYPVCSLFNFWGEEQKVLDKYKDKFVFQDKASYTSGGFEGLDGDADYAVERCFPIYINKEEYFVNMCYIVKYTTPEFMKFYWKYVILFSLAVLTVTALYCWRRNVVNKARYAFEDYQRALTNNLAHDLKTPLAVIGGYAENLIEMRKESADEKELNYLSSIMDNVAYTDNIVARTLQLSQTEQIKKLNKRNVDIKTLAERLMDKYRTALEERNIELKIDGNSKVIADEELLSTAVENLISNAVKYTRDGGAISITADKKRFNIVNDVVENVDTKDLLMPFVKGDKARSDKRSSGLGLAIALAAAEQNGFKLKIECKDKKFSAAINY